jgi:two-component system response regulator DctR
MRLLIIDSSAEIIQRLEEMLSESKIITAILTSVSYETGIKLFKEYKPDVVLLDIFLPENKSLKLLDEMKAAKYEKSIIILSDNSNDNNRLCKFLGVDYLLDTYHDFEKIPGIINRISYNNKVIKKY